jgi:hypothetical protein
MQTRSQIAYETIAAAARSEYSGWYEHWFLSTAGYLLQTQSWHDRRRRVAGPLVFFVCPSVGRDGERVETGLVGADTLQDRRMDTLWLKPLKRGVPPQVTVVSWPVAPFRKNGWTDHPNYKRTFHSWGGYLQWELAGLQQGDDGPISTIPIRSRRDWPLETILGGRLAEDDCHTSPAMAQPDDVGDVEWAHTRRLVLAFRHHVEEELGSSVEWVPKFRAGSTCPDCEGRGVMPLFTSAGPCDCRAALRRYES